MNAAKQIGMTSTAALDLHYMKKLPLTVWRAREPNFLPRISVDEDQRIARLVKAGMIYCGPSQTAKDDARGTYRDVTLTARGASMLRLLKRGNQ